VTYPDPHRTSSVRSVGDRERRVTLLVILGSAVAAGATATAGLLTALGLL
jgi:NaMN:DMB phosphoribosyltransferase